MRRHDSTPRFDRRTPANPARPTTPGKDNRSSALLARALLVEGGEPATTPVPAHVPATREGTP